MTTRTVLALSLIMLLASTLPLAAKKSTPAPETKGQALKIAPQVAAVMDADVAQRKNRVDIPMTYLQTLHLPAQQNLVYPIFLFQMKNADLNFSPRPENPGVLQASHLAFVRIYRLEGGTVGAIVKEHFIHFDLEEAEQGFQPEALNYYSIAGDIFPAGSYMLALAISTPDYSRISTCYSEFTLPDFAQLKDRLATTPVFSVRSLQMLPAPDSKLVVRKNSFIYNTLLMEPCLKNEYKASESLDLFYFILGAQSDSATNALSLQISYVFKKDGREVNKFPPQTVNSPIISQPIAFTFTEVTKDSNGIEKGRMEKLLEAGDYVLEIHMLDNISKKTGLQEFKFKIVL
jgi:hypothetical protein